MPVKPPPEHPWNRKFRLSPPPTPSKLTAVEVRALRQAHSSGRFSMNSLARIYDVNWGTVRSALKDTYKPRMDH